MEVDAQAYVRHERDRFPWVPRRSGYEMDTGEKRSMKTFSELTEAEIDMMIERCEIAAVEYAEEIHMAGGLSTSSYNVYQAIENAIRDEHAKATKKGRIYQQSLTDDGRVFWDSYLHPDCVEVDPGTQRFTTGHKIQ